MTSVTKMFRSEICTELKRNVEIVDNLGLCKNFFLCTYLCFLILLVNKKYSFKLYYLLEKPLFCLFD